MINVASMIEEMSELDQKRAEREEKLKEIRAKMDKTFAEFGKLLTKSLVLEHLLKLNNTKSYSQIVHQGDLRFRLSVAEPPPLSSKTSDESEPNKKTRRRGRKIRGT
jgi:hypothetical protein